MIMAVNRDVLENVLTREPSALIELIYENFYFTTRASHQNGRLRWDGHNLPYIDTQPAYLVYVEVLLRDHKHVGGFVRLRDFNASPHPIDYCVMRILQDRRLPECALEPCGVVLTRTRVVFKYTAVRTS